MTTTLPPPAEAEPAPEPSPEAFDPKGRVERSVQTVEEASTKSEQRGEQDSSVARNIPPEQQGQGQGQGTRGSENQRRTEETTNFEVSRTQVRESIDPGSIRRVSVAVLVDGVRQADASGAQAWSWCPSMSETVPS